MIEKFVATSDNPYDYFKEFAQWNNFDTAQGYNTLSLVARLCNSSEELSESEEEQAIDEALNSVVELNVTGKENVFYKFVYPKTNK